VYVGFRGGESTAEDGDETPRSIFDADVEVLRCIIPAIAAAGLWGWAFGELGVGSSSDSVVRSRASVGDTF
jgi:hypothetical protein